MKNLKSNKFVVRLLMVPMLMFSHALWAQVQSPVIPKPQEIAFKQTYFNLSNESAIQIRHVVGQKAAYYLQTKILKHTGVTLEIKKNAVTNIIYVQASSKELKGNSYQLLMSANQITVKAADEEGFFLGTVTLLQLVRNTPVIDQKLKLACWDVSDKPLYGWRGFMLDESRHFFGKEKVKDILDWMAFYKLNKFHWHLTDQPGWRIEIRKYPRLTLVGGIGNYSDPLAPAQYYTQEDIKEIVRYAAERYIEVIPEIDMPGHATAANMAYPQFSGGGSEKYPEFTFNPANDATYQYLTDILKEVNVLFPSQKIHIGADEVHFGNQHWHKDVYVQKLVKEKGFKDLKEVEHYFLNRMADTLLKMDNEILAWDEVVGSSLPTEKTTVFWWRHDKKDELKKSLKKGFKTVLCPRLPLYFDFVQNDKHSIGRKWAGGYVPIESVYNFPTEDILNYPNAGKLIQGIQANLWTEAVSTEQHLEYMLFPRITALAESAWTQPQHKDYSDYQGRLKKHLSIYAKEGLYYYDPFNPEKYNEFLGPVQRSQMTPGTDELTKQEMNNK